MRRERALDQVVVAHRCAAQRDNRVGARALFGNFASASAVSGRMPRSCGFAAPILDHRRETVSGRGDDAAVLARFARS